MIKKIIKKLFNNECTVTVSQLIRQKIENNNFESIIFKDARDTIFYALGQSDLEENVCCIIDESELSSAYTGLVEAVMRKKSFILIVMKNKNSKCNLSFLNNYKISSYYGVDVLEDKVCIRNKRYAPILIICDYIKVNDEENKLMYEYVQKNIELMNDNISIVNSSGIVLEKKKDILDIKDDNYGVISRYLAMIQDRRKKILLCKPINVELDLNIFNSRYMTKDFKVIVVGRTSINISNWCDKNNIRYMVYEKNNFKEMLEKILKLEEPVLLEEEKE